ncbi:MAG: patatin-like phospholipase family protein [Candidatus Omnitrophica bacterium]|nr:patatin-like phospholipase family protein [Candidatus Omnitrophota bacterium]
MIDKNLILKEIPLFADLTVKQRDILKENSSFVEYKKGEIIYREHSPASAFYCVVLGRVVIFTQGSGGQETILEYLHRGKYFGIISLLTQDTHSVTAKAINDCLLLAIKKEDFDFILKKIPQLAIDLSQTLSRRLKNKDIHQKTIFETSIVSVFSSYKQTGKTIYALNLAISLARETHKSVAILDICLEDATHSLPRKLDYRNGYKVFDLSFYSKDTLPHIKDFILKNKYGIDLICFTYKHQDESCAKNFMSILSMLVNDYNYLILDLPCVLYQAIFDILNQSDSIHILTSPESLDLKKTHNLVERLKTDFHFQEAKIKVIINEYKLSKINHQRQLELLNHPIFATLPKMEFCASDKPLLDEPDAEYSKVIKRIARQVGDCLVGLALGVGVAYGFCHIGVLKVIEEEKIPIDAISGTSIGAIIASLWAIGKSSEEILEITKEFKEPKHIWSIIDLTFPSLGFIKGNKLYNFLKKHLGNKTFQDVRLPLKIVASDIRRKESRVLDNGLLVDAIMTTCSMPGVFRPFRAKEDILLDGGIINPLPTEVLFKMGVKKIIAVNVTPSREDILKEYARIKEGIVSTAEAVRKRNWFSFRQYLRERFKTNIIGLIFSSIEVMQSEMAQKEAQLADIVLHPDTQGLFWLELHRSVDFAKRGEEEMRKNLDKIWQVINE